jgi:hypothetical protein
VRLIHQELFEANETAVKPIAPTDNGQAPGFGIVQGFRDNLISGS